MAKQIIWSRKAQNDRKEILDFWINHNQSNTYSEKLDRKFREAIILIKHYPKIGKLTDDQKARIKIVKDYLLIYEETESNINILTIWDTRQNPEKLEKI